MGWTYWNEVGGHQQPSTAITDIGRASLKEIDPDAELYRWDFRIVRPIFVEGDEQKVAAALEPKIFIHETWHKLLCILDLRFESDVRHTVFSAVTLPEEPHGAASLTLLRWPTTAFDRMLVGGVPDRVRTRYDGAFGQRRRLRPIAEPQTPLIGVAIKVNDIPNLEGP
jgi:hypothetical protein